MVTSNKSMAVDLELAADGDDAAEKLLKQANGGVDGSLKADAIVTFTEGLTRTGFGKFNFLLIFVSGMVLANVLLETAAIGFILPIAQCDLALSNQDKGVLSAISFVGIISSSHLWGFLADTKGRRRVIRPTLLIAFGVTVLSSFSHHFWVMVLLRFTNGFFVSGGSATIYAYLGEFHIESTRSRAMMGSAFIFALGAMILPILAFLVINQDWVLPLPLLGIDYKPWRFFMIVCGIPGCICGLALFKIPESPKFLLSMGREQETIAILQQMHRWNGGKGDLLLTHITPDEGTYVVAPVAAEKTPKANMALAFLHTMWQQTVPLFHRKYLRVTLIVCMAQFWLYVATNGLYMWFPHIINSMIEFMNAHPGEHKRICDIVVDKHQATYKADGSIECITKLEETTYAYSFLMEIIYASSFAFIGLVINHVGKKTVMFVSIIFFSCCGLAAIIVADPAIAAYLYVLLFLVGVAINVLGAATVDLYPTNLRAMAICISLMIGRLGSVVGANIAGALLATHCELTFYITCSALILCAFLCLLLPRGNAATAPPVQQQLEQT